MDKLDILDATFTIPVRIENADRLKNLKNTIVYLLRHFSTNVIVGELSKKSNKEVKAFCQKLNCGYVHFETNNAYFHRTKLLNDLARIVTTPILINFDADIMLQPTSVIQSIELLRDSIYDIIIPYNGKVMNVVGTTSSTLVSKAACGGAVFWKRKSFFTAGMENENFIDWGFEDNERLSRAKKLNLKIYKMPLYTLFHLDHPHEKNRKDVKTDIYLKNNFAEFRKIMTLEKDKLVEYIKTWPWLCL